MNRQQLVQRYQQLRDEMRDSGVAMLAVSKYAPDDAVQVLKEAGHTRFAESRPQNLRDRAGQWPECEWHMIGPVQKNKAKYIARHAAMWHSCDNLETARSVARHVSGRTLPVLIQINIANVPGQYGVQSDAAPALIQALADVQGLQLAGLMCMAPRDGDVRQAFRAVRSLRDTLFGGSLRGADNLELSMGMSGDYRVAVQEGATMVRLGSVLFGDWDVRTQRN
ncbi:MAG: YggS family pyridoxal phosphate-dependent enzyme [Mariprofundus sp.]